MAVPFPQTNGAHLVGQPFTISNLSIPVNALLHCNCMCASGAAPAAIPIIASAPAQCPNCLKTYGVTFNPQNGQLQVAVVAEADRIPS
jgi:hypothetical protein